jgi:hypothetical protein
MADLSHGSPPFNRVAPRIRDSRGGANGVLFRRTLAPGMDNEMTRYPGTANDTTIQRDKTAWYPTDNLLGTASGWYNWTAAGPARPELHMRDVTMRIMQGTSRSRNLQNPLDPTTGLHSMPTPGAVGPYQRFLNPKNPRMRKPRVDRLADSQFSGQSYSATTRTQGGR